MLGRQGQLGIFRFVSYWLFRKEKIQMCLNSDRVHQLEIALSDLAISNSERQAENEILYNDLRITECRNTDLLAGRDAQDMIIHNLRRQLAKLEDRLASAQEEINLDLVTIDFWYTKCQKIDSQLDTLTTNFLQAKGAYQNACIHWNGTELPSHVAKRYFGLSDDV